MPGGSGIEVGPSLAIPHFTHPTFPSKLEHMFAPTPQTETRPTPLAEIIREETDDGRLIVRVLMDIAQGKIDDTKPHHRIAAAKELFRHRFDHMPDHTCGADDQNDSLTAANTTDEEFKKPSDDVPGSDQPSEIAVAAESEIDHPTENTDSAALEPDQAAQEPGPTDLDPVQPRENPDTGEPRSRRTGRARRRQKRNSATPPGPHHNDTGNSQRAVDSVVSAGFR